MASPARPERSRSARSSRQLSRFYHSINPDRVFGTHKGVVPGRHVGDPELAIGAGDRVIGVVDDINPSFHPAVRVAADTPNAPSRQLRGNSLSLVQQRRAELGAFP